MRLFTVLLCVHIASGMHEDGESLAKVSSRQEDQEYLIQENRKLTSQLQLRIVALESKSAALERAFEEGKTELQQVKLDNARLQAELLNQEQLVSQCRSDVELVSASCVEAALNIKADIGALKSITKKGLQMIEQSLSRLFPVWTEWTDFSSCSASCGEGIKQRTRACETPATRCSGPAQKEATCNLGACPAWGEWSQFRPCSATCGNGTKTRSRACNNGTGCSGPTTDTVLCNLESCPDVLLIAGGARQGPEVLSFGFDPCEITLPDLPVGGSFGSFFMHRNDPVFCSGYNDRGCFKYSPDCNAWKRFSKLTAHREGAALLQLDEDYILIAGGSGWSYKNTTDFWNPETEQFTPGPELPYAVAYHCIAAINQTHALMTGGYDGLRFNRTALFNRESEMWTEMEPMTEERYNHGCGLIGESKVLIAGGWNGKGLSSVEVFDLKTQTWSQGQPLPFPVSHATSVQIKGTFLMVGGEDQNGYSLDTVLEFEVENNNWKLWEQKMKAKRRNLPAVYKLPADYFTCA